MTAVLDNIPKQVSDDGIAAQAEIARLRAERTSTPPVNQDPTAQAGQTQDEQPPVAVVVKPTYEELETKTAKLLADLDAQRKEFDRKWGERGAKMEQFNAQMAARNDEIKALKAEMDVINQSKGKAGGSQSDEAPKSMEDSIQELYETYGEDFVKGVKKTVGKDVDDLRARMDQQDKKFQSLIESEAQVKQARAFWDDFESLCPGALALNGDPTLKIPANPDFLKYLDESVPLFDGSTITKTRRVIAEELSANGALQDLAQLFKGFVSASKPQNENPQLKLMDRVQPVLVRTVSSDTPSPGGKLTVYRESEMDAWNRSIQEGRSVTAEEFKAKTEEFNRAAAEGRILWGK